MIVADPARRTKTAARVQPAISAATLCAKMPEPHSLQFDIRRGVAADAEMLAPFAQRVFHQTFSGDPDHKPHDMEMFFRDSLSAAALAAEMASDAMAYDLAFHNGRLAGYLKICWDHAPDCVPYRHTLEIGRLYVDFDYPRSGVAHLLMEKAVERARKIDCDGMWLGVWHRNLRAQRFYRKWGFEHVGEHPFIFGTDHQTDLVFARPMNLATRPRP